MKLTLPFVGTIILTGNDWNLSLLRAIIAHNTHTESDATRVGAVAVSYEHGVEYYIAAHIPNGGGYRFAKSILFKEEMEQGHKLPISLPSWEFGFDEKGRLLSAKKNIGYNTSSASLPEYLIDITKRFGTNSVEIGGGYEGKSVWSSVANEAVDALSLAHLNKPPQIGRWS